jgi:hypothetical protein
MPFPVYGDLCPGLDPTWEQTFEFAVADENSTKCFVKFLMGEEGAEQQIGDECKPLVWQRLCFGRGPGPVVSPAAVLLSIMEATSAVVMLVGAKSLKAREPTTIHFVPPAPAAVAAAGEYLLNVLVANKPTYKGLIIPGGKVDMMFTARGFGKEEGG